MFGAFIDFSKAYDSKNVEATGVSGRTLTQQRTLGHANLINSLSSSSFENSMREGGHFPLFIKNAISHQTYKTH